jgi:hypothetical protein
MKGLNNPIGMKSLEPRQSPFIMNPFRFGGAAGVGGWVELGRTTLGASNDDIEVNGFADKRYYMVLMSDLPTGNTQWTPNVGNTAFDTGSNYAVREAYNGAADGTVVSTSSLRWNASITSVYNQPKFGVGYISNLSTKEKLAIYHGVSQETAGAATSPKRAEVFSKWTNTSSVIDRIRNHNVETGSFNTGSEVVVLGWDPADTHTSNFWEELGTDTGNGSDGTLDIAFTAKKYLWGQAWLKSSSASGDLVIRMGNDTIETTDVYASRQSENGGGDTTFTTHSSILCTPRAEDEFFINFFVINNASNEKLVTGHVVSNTTAGAGTAPQRGEIVGKYVNTSTQANQIRLTVDLGNLTTASYFKLWGSD